MSPTACQVLMQTILPILTAQVPRVVYPANAEDAEELVQDAVATAAQMLEADEKAGRKSFPGSIAYYSIQRLKAGRRSYSSSTTDVLSPHARQRNLFSVVSMDQPTDGGDPDGDEDLCIADTLACRRDDPATEACRRLDWDEFMQTQDQRGKIILNAIARGVALNKTAAKLGISPPRLTQIKDRIGRDVKWHMGERIMQEIREETPWRKSVRCLHEKDACRYERAVANQPVLKFPRLTLHRTDPPEAA